MKYYAPSSELQRVAEEKERNEKRHMEWLRKSVDHRYNAYKDKKVCEEYEHFLDTIGHP